ncbi:chemotaxis protein CheD [Aquibacillus albus]|uniref:Probable chemoreceptor glutamine deamidase CheD n=1 Tax=Aquibacillus albus TaxID=1168171 RepID=A0ABS2N129_9BACI|nr:chemotaxis protein CheD [Aquibacillus albus]MBM7571843.1 chemotaxis protein CheD [Aquibacillus albus]
MNERNHVLKVGIADLKIAKSTEVLRTSGLGSCVGIVIYDLSMKLAGMVHVMLPDSTLSKRESFNALKYADTAIAILYNSLLDNGARKCFLKAKIAGGAQMFSFSSNSDMLSIGNRNVEAVLSLLKQYKIPLISSDVGGNSGRTIEFYPESGILKIKTVNLGVFEI